MRSRFSPPGSSGFTLVELLVVIAVAAILATLAVPSLRTTMHNNQLDTVSNMLVAALATARSEAVRAPEATVQVSNPLGGLQWSSGWITQSTSVANGTVNLQAPSAPPGQVTVFSNVPGPIGFDPMGRLLVPGGTTPLTSVVFVICADPNQPPVNQSRAVIVTASGRASIAHIGTSGASAGLPLLDTGPVNTCQTP